MDGTPQVRKAIQHDFVHESSPDQTETIETYLSSGMIKGLGPGTASKIVKYFGAKTLDVLSSCPDRLMEIPGIGEKKCETIANSWKEQMAVQDIMVFLSGCGITPIFAAKIYRSGRNAMQIVQDNPINLRMTLSEWAS